MTTLLNKTKKTVPRVRDRLSKTIAKLSLKKD
jgi:hypothetical protein